MEGEFKSLRCQSVLRKSSWWANSVYPKKYYSRRFDFGHNITFFWYQISFTNNILLFAFRTTGTMMILTMNLLCN